MFGVFVLDFDTPVMDAERIVCRIIAETDIIFFHTTETAVCGVNAAEDFRIGIRAVEGNAWHHKI